MPKVLIVDDQPAVRTALETLFEVHDLPALSVGTMAEALDLIASEDIGAVVQDMNYTQNKTSGEEGVELFRAIRALDPEMPVLMMTAWASLETAVALIKEGATDYMAKPWNDDKLVATVRNLVNLRALKQENVRLQAQARRARRVLAAGHNLCKAIYESAEMHAAVRLAVTVAPSDAPVLITGPNGSGKEKLAEIVQANSRRKDKPFIKVNVGALPDNLFEAELFGAEAGAFTGAQKMRVGRFEAAHGGTLFLDEMGTLSAAAQAKLLRVLQTGEYERLGSSTTRKADVRIISATNTDLPKAIADGSFREDLFFRLNVIELHVPALADRPDDIRPLAEHFLAELATKEGKGELHFSDDAMAALLAYEWPGNVRELQNRIQRAVLVETGLGISAAGLALPAGEVEASRGATAKVAASASAPATTPAASIPTSSADAAERAAIEEALGRARGVVSRAAAEMGLSRQALYRRMERLGLSLERRVR
jgi:DNA-binding NtrC family response regulator